MQNSFKGYIILFSLITGLTFGFNSFAEPHGHSGGDAHGKSKHAEPAKKHGKKSGKGHNFSAHWAKTLSDEQKISVDKMHLQVGQLEAVQKAKMKMLKAELDVMVANPSNKQSSIYAKIDEILAVKKIVMRNRYDHIAEMRAELTEQQRISYDMGLLKHGKHKH